MQAWITEFSYQKQGQYCLLSCFNLRGCMEIITAFHGISSACLYNHYINKHFNGHLYSLAKKRHLCTRISSFRISKYVILILVLDLKYICPSLYGVQWIILLFVFHTSITFLFKLNVDSRGGSRVVQVIYRNHSNFFPNLISQLFVAVHEINYPSCFIVYYEIKQSRNYSVDLTDLTDASLDTFLNTFVFCFFCFVLFFNRPVETVPCRSRGPLVGLRERDLRFRFVLA